MPPEELKQHIERIKQEEQKNAEALHDAMLSTQRANDAVTHTTHIAVSARRRKAIVTIIAILILAGLGIWYAWQQGWLKKKPAVDPRVEKALQRMDEIQKANPPVTEADVKASQDFITDLRTQESKEETEQTVPFKPSTRK